MRYDYVCDDCRIIEEVEHGMLAKPEVECASCNAPMRKVLNSDMIIQIGTAQRNLVDRWKLEANHHFKRKHGIRQYVDP